MKKVYLITTGHSPREDISIDLRNHFSDEIEAIELGALDEFTPEEVKEMFAPVDGEATMVARLRNGEMYAFSESKAMPLVQAAITKACDEGADAIIILCTTDFPKLESSVPVLFPGDLEHKIAVSVAGGCRVSYLFPFASHAPGMMKGWEELGLPGNYMCYHHLSGDPFDPVLEFLKNDESDIVILDCIGYSFDMAAEIVKAVNKPVIHPRTILVNLTHALLGLSEEAH